MTSQILFVILIKKLPEKFTLPLKSFEFKLLLLRLLLDVEVTIDTKLYTVKTKARNLRELNDSSIAGGSLQSLLVSGSQNTVDSDSIIFRQSSLE